MQNNNPLVVANYLPQYHDVLENDRWWGKGFTEWSSVAMSKPQFAGHFQPNPPQGLGFYSLTEPSIFPKQTTLAKSFGIDAFMYYFYFFGGRRLLAEPTMLRSAMELGHSFFFCWANESWARTWDGRDKEVLLLQTEQLSDADTLISEMAPSFENPDYLKVEGKPLLAIYRPGRIPRIETFIKRLNRAAQKIAGFPGVAVLLTESKNEKKWNSSRTESLLRRGLILGTHGFPPHGLPRKPVSLGDFGQNLIADYLTEADWDISRLRSGSLSVSHFPGVMPGFDNSPRKGRRSLIFRGSNPFTFRRWIVAALEREREMDRATKLVFVNSWNEWGEGSQLEPSRLHGLAMLEAVRDATS